MLARLGASAIRATFFLDRAYRWLDRGRSLLVTAYATDEVLQAYNDLTYGATSVYDAANPQFRQKLFNWEANLVKQVFPEPPGRVLVGGAGGGREAFQLASMGYEVTAFEPSAGLAQSMRDRAAQTGAAVEALRGRYEDLPVLRRVESGAPHDLRSGKAFNAAILGWTSYSHVRDTRDRVAALKAFAAVTDGPVVASFFMTRPPAGERKAWKRRLSRIGRRKDGDEFSGHIGFYHLSSREELEAEAAAAGLVVVDASYDESDGHWPWIAVARPEIAAGRIANR